MLHLSDPVHAGSATVSRREAVQRLTAMAGLGAGAALAACRTPAAQPPAATSALSGTFELLSQDWVVLNVIHEQAVASFQQKHPQARVTAVPYGDLPTKIQAAIAAGAGFDGYFHYSRPRLRHTHEQGYRR